MGWIAIPIEPFPFGLLTLIVSLEAILLSGLILNATNRSVEVDRTLMNNDIKTNNNNLEIDKSTNAMVKEILNLLEDK